MGKEMIFRNGKLESQGILFNQKYVNTREITSFTVDKFSVKYAHTFDPSVDESSLTSEYDIVMITRAGCLLCNRAIYLSKRFELKTYVIYLDTLKNS